MHYIAQVYTYFFPPILSFQHLSDAIIKISSYLPPSGVRSLVRVERYTFTYFKNSQVLAPILSHAVVDGVNIDYVLRKPDYILNNIRKIDGLMFGCPDKMKKLLSSLPQLEEISFLNLNPSSATDAKLFQMLPVQLEGLKVSTSFGNHLYYITELTKLTSLKKFKLSNGILENETFSPLLKSLTQLTNLSINVIVRKRKEVDELFLYQKNLIKLNICMAQKLDKTELYDYFISSATSLTQLTNLSLSNLSIKILNPINQLTQLNELNVKFSCISNTELQKVTQLTQLKKLSLTNNELMTNLACQAICQQFPLLESLDLSNTNVTDDGLNSFINLKKLKVLTIDCCQVSAKTTGQLREGGIKVYHHLPQNS